MIKKDFIKSQDSFVRQLPYAYWLDNIKGIGKVKIKQLLEWAGTPENIYYMPLKELKKVLSEKQLWQYQNQKNQWNLYTEYDKLIKQKIRFVFCQHPEYPEKLKAIPDAPYGIYMKGKLPDDRTASVAVIGARSCSQYGRGMAREFGSRLAEAGIQVVSGLAIGIDGISQKGAIDAGGETYGVLGCGVDICYPAENKILYQQIIEQGGILSEYLPGTIPKSNYFPPRNRIISALSDVILVIEAKQKSGTLITVDMALEQGKDVYAVPGRITDDLSFGCNRLIKQGAGIVLSPGEFIEELCELGIHNKKSGRVSESEYDKSDKSQSENLKCGIGINERKILNFMDDNPQSVEIIYEKAVKENAGITIPILLQELLQLQMKGLISQIGSSYYIICK